MERAGTSLGRVNQLTLAFGSRPSVVVESGFERTAESHETRLERALEQLLTSPPFDEAWQRLSPAALTVPIEQDQLSAGERVAAVVTYELTIPVDNHPRRFLLGRHGEHWAAATTLAGPAADGDDHRRRDRPSKRSRWSRSATSSPTSSHRLPKPGSPPSHPRKTSLIRDTRARGQRLTLRDRPRHRRPTRSRVRRLGRRTRVPLGRRVTRCLGRPCKRGDWAGSDDCNLTRSERERASGRTTPDRPQRASAAPSSRRLLCGQRSRKRFGGSVIGERGAVGARHSPCRAGGRSRLKPPPWGRHAAGALRPPCARCRAGAARSGRRRPCRSDRGGCEHPSSRRCS